MLDRDHTFVSAPAVGEFYAGQFVDGSWYRCRVDACDLDRNVTVTYIDYGNKEVVPCSKLRKLRPEWCSPPGQVGGWEVYPTYEICYYIYIYTVQGHWQKRKLFLLQSMYFKWENIKRSYYTKVGFWIIVLDMVGPYVFILCIICNTCTCIVLNAFIWLSLLVRIITTCIYSLYLTLNHLSGCYSSAGWGGTTDG